MSIRSQLVWSLVLLIAGVGLAIFGWTSTVSAFKEGGIAFYGCIFAGGSIALAGLGGLFRAWRDASLKRVHEVYEAGRQQLEGRALELARQESGQDPPPNELVYRKRQELEIAEGIADVNTIGYYLTKFHDGPPTAAEQHSLQLLASMLPPVLEQANAMAAENNEEMMRNLRSDEPAERMQMMFAGQPVDPQYLAKFASTSLETISQIVARTHQSATTAHQPPAQPVAATFEALCQELHSGDAGRVKLAIAGLAELGDARAIPYLEPLLASDDMEILQPAAKAISGLEGN